MTRAPFAIRPSAHRSCTRYASSISISGKVLLNCGIGFRSRSARRMSSAPRRRCSSVNIDFLRLSYLDEIFGPSRAVSLDGRPGQNRLTRLHHVAIVERVPGRDDTGVAGVRGVVSNEIPDQRTRDAKLNIGFDVRIAWMVDLRNENLEPTLEDQRMQMSRTIGMPALRPQKVSHHPVGRNGISDHFDGPEPKAPVFVGREFAA